MERLRLVWFTFLSWWSRGVAPKVVILGAAPAVLGTTYFAVSQAQKTIPLSPQNLTAHVAYPQASVPATPRPTPTPIPTPEPPPTYTNILLIGYGGKGHAGGSLSDALLVLHLDFPKKKLAVITVPRDLWYEDESGGGKINRMHATGGGEAAKTAVGKVIKMKIHHYVSVDFSGFAKAIDALGNITVVVPHTFDDYFYPVRGLENEACGKTPEEIADLSSKLSGFELEKQFPCRYEHLHFTEGAIEMDGATALKFVRSRHSNEHGGDFARSQRQKAVVNGVVNKLLSLGAAKKVPEFFKRFSSSIKTDLTVQQTQTVVKDYTVYPSLEFTHVGLSTANILEAKNQGGYALIPKDGGNWDHVAQFVREKL